KSATFKGIVRGSTAHIYQTTASADMQKVTDRAISGGEFTYSLRPNSITILICGPEKEAEISYSGEYTITSEYNSRVIHADWNSSANGANVVMWDDSGLNCQKWMVTSVGGNYYQIVDKHTGKAMDVTGYSTENGANIQQWNYHGGSNQKWSFQDLGDGIVNIVSQFSGKCADIEGWVHGNGGNVQQWTINGSANKKWRLSQP
ncbi:MAG: RICIN domain-containing protein, partial [Verrucomicrobiota bacterium]